MVSSSPTNADAGNIVNGEVNIDVISVSGNHRTHRQLFSMEMHRIKYKMSINDLNEELGVIQQRLLNMDIFDTVEIRVKPSSNKADKLYSVLVDVKEKGKPYLKMSSYVKAGLTAEVGFELSGALRNPLGYGESCKLSSVTTQSGAREFASGLYLPKVAGRSANLNLTLRTGESNRQYYSSFKEHSTSLLVDLSSIDRKHQLTLEYALRDEIPVSSSAAHLFKTLLAKDATTPDPSSGDRWAWHPSPVTMQSLKPSLKTSIKYFCTALDNLDSLSNPSKGSLLQGSIELALHPGGCILNHNNDSVNNPEPIDDCDC
jgi:outer membrane protein assembly factor BamA